MSIFLYRLGGLIAKHRGLVLGVWLLVLGSLGGGAAMLGDRYDDSFSIPGTESQEGQDLLADRFGLTGANGQVLFDGQDGQDHRLREREDRGHHPTAIGKVKGVSLSNPLTADDPDDQQGQAGDARPVRFADAGAHRGHPRRRSEGWNATARSAVSTSVGGDAYKSTADPSNVPELLGLLVSFLILALTFGSLLAAGMPILTVA